MTYRPCLVCGEPSPSSRCDDHELPARAKPSAHARGYDSTWTDLSVRARRLQPFCLDCGTTEDLTTDHSTEAWQRRAAGKPVRLEDVAVVCRSCNGKRGAARPRGGTPPGRSKDPRWKAKSRTLWSAS